MPVVAGIRPATVILRGAVTRAERHRHHLDQVAALIKAARRRAGITQVQLAERMTVAGEPTSRSLVSMWELGAPAGHLPSTAKLLTILEVTRTPDPIRDIAERRVIELESDLAKLRGSVEP